MSHWAARSQGRVIQCCQGLKSLAMSHHPRRAWMVIPFSKEISRPLFQCFQSSPTLLWLLETHFTDHLWWAGSSSKWNSRHYFGHYNSPRTRRCIGAPYMPDVARFSTHFNDSFFKIVNFRWGNTVSVSNSDALTFFVGWCTIMIPIFLPQKKPLSRPGRT